MGKGRRTFQRSDTPSVPTGSVHQLLFVLFFWSSAVSFRLFLSIFVTQRSRMGAVLKQDSQCTYNVTLRRVRLTIVVVQNQ